MSEKLGHKFAAGSWFLLAATLLLLRVLPWSAGEFSHDEVFTLAHFCDTLIERPFWQVFRYYPEANNHILSSALYWLWLKIIPATASESLYRLPSLLAGLGTLAVLCCWWQKWLGRTLAGLAALTFALSPVYTAFVYQIRGYSLSLLLAVIALAGLLECLSGRYPLGCLTLAVSSLLQPLIMPSGLMLAPLLAAALLLGGRLRGFSWRRLAWPLLLLLTASLLGGGYYLSLGEQFGRAAASAARNAAGLWDCPSAMGNVALAFLAHGSLLPVAALAGLSRYPQGEKHFRQSLGLVLLLACLGAIPVVLGGLALSGRMPFPRAFLIFLPPFTLSLLLLCRQWRPLRRPLLSAAAASAVILLGLTLESFCQHLTRRQVAAGRRPLHLLQQYYRGASDHRSIVHSLRDSGLEAGSIALVCNYDNLTVVWYYQRLGLDLRRMFIPLEVPENFWRDRFPRLPLLVWTSTRAEAEELFQYAGCRDSSRIAVLQHFRDYTLYTCQPEAGR